MSDARRPLHWQAAPNADWYAETPRRLVRIRSLQTGYAVRWREIDQTSDVAIFPHFGSLLDAKRFVERITTKERDNATTSEILPGLPARPADEDPAPQRAVPQVRGEAE